MTSTLWLLLELVALFFSVATLVHLTQRRLGPDRLREWMGGPPLLAAVKGIAVGFITPFCTFSAIPMLVGLRQAGVPPAGYVAFITAAPVLDPILFGALVVIVGPAAAVLYSVVAFTAAVSLALVAQRVGIDRSLKPLPVAVGAGVGAAATEPTCGDGDRPPWAGWSSELPDALRSATRLLRSVGPLLLVGVSIGLAIEMLVSPEDVAQLTGRVGVLATPIAALLGTPLYFDTSLFVPIADALSNAGVGTGPIVALTIAGAGANIPEFILLTRLAKARLIVIFCVYVFVVALAGGLLAEALL